MAQAIFVQSVLAETSARLSELAAPCVACHSLEPDGLTHVGPSLAGIAGRELGSDQHYTYSEALTQRALEGGVWDRPTLDDFLKHPQTTIEGTAMSYPGVPDDDDRKILLDWLFSDYFALENANYLADPEVQGIIKLTADVDYGEYLAGECLTCHQSDKLNGQVPPIHKLTQDYFVFALLEYQNGARSNRVMQTIAGALGEEEIAALSAVFSKKE